MPDIRHLDRSRTVARPQIHALLDPFFPRADDQTGVGRNRFVNKLGVDSGRRADPGERLAAAEEAPAPGIRFLFPRKIEFHIPARRGIAGHPADHVVCRVLPQCQQRGHFQRFDHFRGFHDLRPFRKSGERAVFQPERPGFELPFQNRSVRRAVNQLDRFPGRFDFFQFPVAGNRFPLAAAGREFGGGGIDIRQFAREYQFRRRQFGHIRFRCVPPENVQSPVLIDRHPDPVFKADRVVLDGNFSFQIGYFHDRLAECDRKLAVLFSCRRVGHRINCLGGIQRDGGDFCRQRREQCFPIRPGHELTQSCLAVPVFIEIQDFPFPI